MSQVKMGKRIKISISLLFILGIFSLNDGYAQSFPSDTISTNINSGNPAFPFPQFLEYDNGKTLAENNAEGVTHADMEKGMREAYKIMMHRTLYSSETLDGNRYMVFNHSAVPKNNNTFVSEGDGYALLAAAYMADKTTFDGLWLWVHDHRLSGVKRYIDCSDLRPGYRYGYNLPGWKNDASTPEGNGDNDCATDGDYDIAMGLLMAYKQWGENSGITDACGNEINYREEALAMIKAIVDTAAVYSLGSGALSGYCTGDIGIDGYCKNGNTWGEVTNWRYGAGNTAYPWASSAPEAFGSAGNVNVYTDYIGPAYFKQFGDFLQSNGGTAFQINQYRRGEASSDWMMGQMLSKGYIASSGNCSVNDDGSVTSFGNHPSGADGEDFRAAWRTVLNYVWHGNPTTTWDPVTHEPLAGGNTFEYDIGLAHAANLKLPGSNAGSTECSKLGASPDPSCPNYSGVSQIPQLWGQDGSINSQYRTNYNVGVGGPAAVASEDIELLGDIYRQCEIMWDDVSSTSNGLTDDERYGQSTPNYFHGWFRLLGMLTTSGNLHPPSAMEPKANLKVYLSVDKTYAYAGDLLTYTVDYRNYGSVDASNASVNIPLGADLEFVSATAGGISSGGAVSWSVGTVPGFTSTGGAAASSGQMTFTVRVKNLSAPTNECLQATISSSNAPDWLSNEFPNNATYTMERNCVDLLAERALKITKTTNRATMNKGDIVSFYVDFENEASDAAWLNGGRSNVVVSYGNYIPGYNFYQFYRFWHDAPEAYINMNNYRISYFMNDAAAVGLYDAGSNPTGWTFKIDNQSDLDKYGYNPASSPITFTYQAIPPGSDVNGSWNQRLITRFAEVLTAPASHIYDKLDSDYLIHKGVTGPGFIRTSLASNPADDLSSRVLDDWSYDASLDEGQVAAQNARFTPISNNWADPNNLDIPVNNYSRYVCDPDVTSFDRVLVEEFDGYTWRRVAGRGPLPGREVENVVIVDTIPLEMDWFGFTDDEALGVQATYTPSGNPAADGYTGIVRWEIPALLVGESGSFEYQAIAGDITCPGADILFENAVWISSLTDSPDSSKVDLTLTCVKQPDIIDPQTSLVKTASVAMAEVGDNITYTLTYTNNSGAEVDADFTDASVWQTLGNGVLPDLGGSQISMDQNDNSNNPGANGYAFGHTKSHGLNGYLESTWDMNNVGNFSFVLRHTAGTPGQADFQGVRVEIEPRPWGDNTMKIHVYNNTTQIFTTGGTPIAHGGSASPVGIKVELIDDEVFIYVNDFDGVPLQSTGGITNLNAGYVGLYSGSQTNKLLSWKTFFDSAFDLDFYDPYPTDLASITNISNSGVDNSGNIEWSTVPGPILAGEVLVRTFEAEVASCTNFISNIGYADVYGIDSLGSLISVDCGASTCSLDGETASVTEGASIVVSGTDSTLNGATSASGSYTYTWYLDYNGAGETVVGTGVDLTAQLVNADGDYTLVVSETGNASCEAISTPINVSFASCTNPTASILTSGTDLEYCTGATGVTLTAADAGTGATYTWSGPVTGSGITLSNATAGDYTVFVEKDGCDATSTLVTVTEVSGPTAVIETSGADLEYCAGISGVTLTAEDAGTGASYTWSGPVGGTGISLSDATAGDYTVTVDKGCSSISSSVTVIEKVSPTATIDPSALVYCEGTGGVNLSAEPAGADSYQWIKDNSIDITGASYLGATLGDYEVIVMVDGCSDTSDITTVTEDALPESSNAGTDFGICEDNTALAGNDPAVGAGMWLQTGGPTVTITAPGDFNTTVTGITTDGAYTFEWTLSNGSCPSNSSEVTITKSSSATASVGISADKSALCTGESITFTAIPQIGGNLTYQWFVNTLPVGTDSDTYSYVPTAADDVKVQLTTDLSCAVAPKQATSVSWPFTIDEQPSAVTIDQGTALSTCLDEIDLSASLPAIGTLNWALSAGPGSLSGNSGNTVAVMSLGAGASTTIDLINSNGVCPDETAQIVITRTGDLAIPDAGLDVTICESQSTETLTGNDPQGATATWIALSGSISQSGQDGVASGYSVGENRYVYEFDNGSCSATDTVSIFVDELPAIPTINGPDSVATCATNYFLPGNSASTGTVQWQVVSGMGTIVTDSDPASEVTGLIDDQTLELLLVATNGQCTGPSTNFKIHKAGQITTPTAILAGGATDVCLNGGPYSLEASVPSGSETAYWHIESGTSVAVDNVNSPTSSITVLGTGSTELWWVIDNSVCDSAVAKLVLDVSDVPQDAGAISGYDGSPLCEGSTLTLSTPAIVNAVNHIWAFPSGNQTLSPGDDLVFIPTADGMVSVTGINSCGTGVSSEVLLDIVPNTEPTISLSSLPDNAKAICEGEPMQFTAGVTNEGVSPTYRWFINNSLQADNGVSISRNDLTGATNVRVEMDASSEMCNTFSSVQAEIDLVFEDRSVSFDGKFTLCEGEDGCFSEVISGGGTNPVLSWSGAVSSSCHTGLTDGDDVILTLETSNTCSLPAISHTESITVSGGAVAEILTSDTLICKNEVISLQAAVDLKAITYSWFMSEIPSGEFISVGTNSTTLSDVTSAGFYYVLVDDGNGCVDSAGLVEVSQANFEVVPTASPAFVVEGNSTTLNATIVGGAASDFEFSWIDLVTSDEFQGDQVIVTPIKTTTYEVTASQGHCSELGNVVVVLREELEVPSAFTPNGDGNNESWNIPALVGYPQATVRIFNRWGNIVYEQLNGYLEPWDGTINGKYVPVGTYYYIIDPVAEEVPAFEGSVTIVR